MRRRRDESGFVLLVVLMMAAGVAILLYQQLPRVAFESMRAKEEMLIERGEQFQRAIQLYTAKWRKYPNTIDDLEKTNGVRYLRRRYKDPFTGEDEWRLIHVDAMGNLTDSKIKKKDEKKQNLNTFITENAGLGQTDIPGQTGVNVALRRRPSEGGGDPGQAPLPLPSSAPPDFQPAPSPFAQPQQQQNPGAPNTQPQINPATGQPYPPGQGPAQPGQQPMAGQISIQQAYPNGLPAVPGGVGVGQQVPWNNQNPGQTQAQMMQGQFVAGQPPAPMQNQMVGQPFPNQGPGVGQQMGAGPGGQQSGMMSPTTPNGALQAIQRALTSPSPNLPMNMAPGMQLGPGIAGVASKHEAASIKIYAEQQAYDKWEFIYDPKKDKRLLQGVNQALGNMQQGQGMGMQGAGVGGPGMGMQGMGMQGGGIGMQGMGMQGGGVGMQGMGVQGPGMGMQGGGVGMQGSGMGVPGSGFGMQRPVTQPGGTGASGAMAGGISIGSAIGSAPATTGGTQGSATRPAPVQQQPGYPQQPNVRQPYPQQTYPQQTYPQQPNVQQPNVQQPNVQQPNVQQPNAQQPNAQQPGR